MKVMRLEVQNVLRVDEIDWDLEGHNLWLVGGKNGQGKSSAIKALVMALCGRSGCDWPEVPVKDGAKEGVIRVTLDGSENLHEPMQLQAELVFTKRRDGSYKETFRLVDSAGEEAPEPRALLKRLYRSRAFDPLQFERLAPKEQRKMLLEALGVDLEADQARAAEVFANRTSVNRELRTAKAYADAMPLPKLNVAAPVDTAAITKALEDATQHNASIKKAEARRDNAVDRMRTLEREIEALQKKLAEAEQVEEECRQQLAGMKPVDTEPLMEELRTASAKNEAYAQAQERKRAVERVKQLEAEADKLTNTLAAIEQEQRDQLASAPNAIPGLEVDEDGVLINGVPFQQAAQSERIRASMKIGMALNPELRLLVCEDGSALDRDALAEVAKIATDADYQVLVELVTRSEDDERLCSVVLEEGRSRVPA